MSTRTPRVWHKTLNLCLIAVVVGLGLLSAATGQSSAAGSVPTAATPGPKLFLPLAVSGIAAHPRLFFTAGDVTGLRQKARTTHQSIYSAILAYAQSQLSTPPPASATCPDLESFRNGGNKLIAFAFAYVISGDRAYFDLTRNYLLAYAKWQYWGDESACGEISLGFPHMLQGYALAYDWLYNDFTTTDRTTIAKALAAHADLEYQASSATGQSQAWRNWWRRAYTQNHHMDNNGPLGIAALALEGDDSRSTTWLNLAIAMVTRDRDLLEGIADGTWAEGIPYGNYGLTMVLPFMYTLRQLKGIDLLPHTWLRNYDLWRAYNYLPASSKFLMSFGDFAWTWADAPSSQGVLRLASADSRDGRGEWLMQQLLNYRGRNTSVWNAPYYVFEFFYYDPTVAAQAPTGLPLSRSFSDLEGVIWRTGWGASDLAFGFKTGAPGGRFGFDTFTNGRYPWDHPGVDAFYTSHTHNDTNTFYLARGASDLSSETVTYDHQDTSFNNTLLVDGDGQYSQPMTWGSYQYWYDYPSTFKGTDGRLESTYGTPNFSYLIGDATNRYRAYDQATGLPGAQIVSRFKRHVLFIRPNYFLMVDDIRSASAHQYDWVGHFDASATLEGNWIKGVSSNDQVLGANILAPASFATSTGNDGKPYVRVHPASNLANVRFAMLLYPTTGTQWAGKPATRLLVDDEQMLGVQVALNGTQDLLVRYGDQASASGGGYAFNGQTAAIFKDGSGNLQKIFLGHGTQLADSNGARTLVRGGAANMELDVTYSGAALALAGQNLPQGLTIYAPNTNPAQVTLNGQPATVRKVGNSAICVSPPETQARQPGPTSR